jgi:hypothetical protein
VTSAPVVFGDGEVEVGAGGDGAAVAVADAGLCPVLGEQDAVADVVAGLVQAGGGAELAVGEPVLLGGVVEVVDVAAPVGEEQDVAGAFGSELGPAVDHGPPRRRDGEASMRLP